jgi:hypothetical protein
VILALCVEWGILLRERIKRGSIMQRKRIVRISICFAITVALIALAQKGNVEFDSAQKPGEALELK